MSGLTVGTRVAAAFTHVEFTGNQCCGYCQLCDSSTVDDLAEKVDLSAANAPLASSLNAGDVVLALYSEDGVWYRARIESLAGGVASVFFIDYGNKEKINNTDIKVATGELQTIQGLATKCDLVDVLPNENTWTASETEKLTEQLVGFEFTVEIMGQSRSRDGVALRLYSDTGLFKHGREQSSKTKNVKTSSATELQIGMQYNAYLSYVDSANKFWIQLVDQENKLNDLMTSLADSAASGAEKLDRVSAGTLCMTFYSEDQAPYRSSILTVNGNTSLVQFVDYGNSESKNVSELLKLPQHFQGLPAMSLKCCYKRTKVDNNTLEEKLQELTESDGVLVRVLGRTDDVYNVEIDKIENISSVTTTPQVNGQHFPPMELDSTKVYDVCLSYVEHPGRFFIQLLENGPELDQVMVRLTKEFSSNTTSPSLSTGTACIGQLSDDQHYRCVIQSVSGENSWVHAVDFGFDENVSVNKLRAMSPIFLNVPCYATECTVDVTKTLDKFWSSTEINTLKGFESKVSLVARVTTRRNSLYQLDLYDTRDRDEDRYINAEMLGVGKSAQKAHSIKMETRRAEPSAAAANPAVPIPPPEVVPGSQELVCITAVKAPNIVYGQLTKTDAKKIESLQIKLNEKYDHMTAGEMVLSDASVGTSCTTRYSDGGWYRALITQKQGKTVAIAFADFGDETNTQPLELKQMLPEFGILSQQCILCRFPKASSSNSKEMTEKLLLNKVIEVKLISKKDGVYPMYDVEFTSNARNQGLAGKLEGSSLGSKQPPRLPKSVAVNKDARVRTLNRGDGYSFLQVDSGCSEEVMVTHVVDPQHFHVQVTSMAKQLDTMMDKVQAHYDGLTDTEEMLSNPYLGQPCVAKYTDDNSWYRAKVSGLLNNGRAEVTFVDYGNTECLQRETLKIASPQFMELPAQAIFCGLSGVKATQGFWSPEHIAQFEDIALDQNFTAIFQDYSGESEDLYTVKLENQAGEDINLKYGTSTDSVCHDQPDRKVAFGKGMDMKIEVQQNSEWIDPPGNESRDGNRFGSRSGDRGGNRGFGDRSGGGDRSAGFGGGNRNNQNSNEERGFGNRSRDGNRGGGFDGQNRDQERSGGFGGRSNDRGGGFGGQNRDQERGGGFGGRSNDRGGGGFGGQSRDQEKSGGFGGRSNDRGGGFGGQNRDQDRGGGFGGRSNDRGGGFGGQSRDQERSGGFGGRSNDRGGGFGGRSNDRGGGFGGQSRDQERSGGFGGRSNDRGGGFGGQNRDQERSGGFGGRSNDRGGGFGGQSRDQDRGGGFGGRSNDRGGGGFGRSQQAAPTDDDWDTDVSTVVTEKPATTSSAPKSRFRGTSQPSSTPPSSSDQKPDAWSRRVGSVTFTSQKLVADTSCQVYVVFTSSPGEFWCQLVDKATDLQTMMDKMNEHYNSLSPTKSSIDQPEIGMPCVAKFSEDEMWYRAEISSFENNKIEVQFIDYGNSEFVDLKSVKIIQKEFTTLPLQAIRCCLSGVKSSELTWSEKATEIFETLTAEKELVCTVKSQMGGSYLINLEDASGDMDVALKLHEAGYCTLTPVGSGKPQKVVAKVPYPAIPVSLGSKMEVYVSWIEDPSMFWVQPVENQTILEELAEQVQEEYTSGPSADKKVSKISEGMAVVAKFSEDEAWYRAVVESEGKTISVRFVDYGNTDSVAVESLRLPSASLMEVPAQAIYCSLADVKPLQAGEWNVDAKDIMESMVKEAVSCTFKGTITNGFSVDIVSSGTGVAEELISAAVVKKVSVESPQRDTEAPPRRSEPTASQGSVKQRLHFANSVTLDNGTVEPAYISQVNSLSNFYIQLAKFAAQLEALMEKLDKACQLKSRPSMIVPGMACAAKFSGDEMWYRATVSQVNADDADVLFIDYGNSEVVPFEMICEISQDCLSLPPQAVLCSLKNSNNLTDNSVLAKFTDMTMDKEVQVQVISGVSPTIVDISVDDTKSLSSVLTSSSTVSATSASGFKALPEQTIPTDPNCKVFTSYVHSPSMLYLQLASQESNLNDLSSKLQAAYSGSVCDISKQELKKGYLCCTMYVEDNLWYRAEVEEVCDDKCHVLFVDYGNSEEVETSSLKVLAPEFMTQPAMGFRCALDSIVPIQEKWSEEANSHLESLVMDQELTCKFVSKSIVCLRSEDGDVGKDLVAQGYAKLIKAEELKFSQEVKPKGRVSTFVSHLEDVFYLQLGSDEDRLAELSESLQTLCEQLCTPQLEQVSEGLHCCAKFSEDQAWYRATVTKVTGQEVAVRFLDFGNCDIVALDQLKLLNEELLTPELLAYPAVIKGVGRMTEEQQKVFSGLTEEQELMTEFLGMTDDGLNQVTLLTGEGKDIGQEFWTEEAAAALDEALQGDESYIALDKTGYVDEQPTSNDVCDEEINVSAVDLKEQVVEEQGKCALYSTEGVSYSGETNMHSVQILGLGESPGFDKRRKSKKELENTVDQVIVAGTSNGLVEMAEAELFKEKMDTAKELSREFAETVIGEERSDTQMEAVKELAETYDEEVGSKIEPSKEFAEIAVEVKTSDERSESPQQLSDGPDSSDQQMETMKELSDGLAETVLEAETHDEIEQKETAELLSDGFEETVLEAESHDEIAVTHDEIEQKEIATVLEAETHDEIAETYDDIKLKETAHQLSDGFEETVLEAETFAQEMEPMIELAYGYAKTVKVIEISDEQLETVQELTDESSVKVIEAEIPYKSAEVAGLFETRNQTEIKLETKPSDEEIMTMKKPITESVLPDQASETLIETLILNEPVEMMKEAEVSYEPAQIMEGTCDETVIADIEPVEMKEAEVTDEAAETTKEMKIESDSATETVIKVDTIDNLEEKKSERAAREVEISQESTKIVIETVLSKDVAKMMEMEAELFFEKSELSDGETETSKMDEFDKPVEIRSDLTCELEEEVCTGIEQLKTEITVEIPDETSEMLKEEEIFRDEISEIIQEEEIFGDENDQEENRLSELSDESLETVVEVEICDEFINGAEIYTEQVEKIIETSTSHEPTEILIKAGQCECTETEKETEPLYEPSEIKQVVSHMPALREETLEDTLEMERKEIFDESAERKILVSGEPTKTLADDEILVEPVKKTTQAECSDDHAEMMAKDELPDEAFEMMIEAEITELVEMMKVARISDEVGECRERTFFDKPGPTRKNTKTSVEAIVERELSVERKSPGEPVIESDESLSPGEPVNELDKSKLPGEPVNESDERKSADQPVYELDESKSCDQPVNELDERKSADQPVNELDERKSADQPVNESEERKSSDKPVYESDESKSYDQPVNESDESKSYEQPVNESDERKSADQAVNELDKRKSSDQPVYESDERKSADQAVNELDKRKSSDKPVKFMKNILNTKYSHETAEVMMKGVNEPVEILMKEETSDEQVGIKSLDHPEVQANYSTKLVEYSKNTDSQVKLGKTSGEDELKSVISEFLQGLQDAVPSLTQVLSPCDDSHVLRDDEVDGTETSTNECGDASSMETTDDLGKLTHIVLAEGDRVQVTSSHINSPSSFYVHLDRNKDALNTLLDEMFKFYSEYEGSDLTMSSAKEGKLCAVQYSEDESWYRAKVLEVLGSDKFKVEFLDHGNIDECTGTGMRKLLTRFVDLPVQTMHCTLGGVRSVDGPWSEEALELFNTLLGEKSLLADVLCASPDDAYIVELFDMGILLSQKFIEEGFGVEASTPTYVSKKTKRVFSDSTPLKAMDLSADISVDMEEERYPSLGLTLSVEYNCCLSHAISPGQFWLQLLETQDDLQTFMDRIQEKYSKEKPLTLEEVKPGMACVGLYSEDGLWYRVTVMDKTDTNVEVIFVDYGNSKTVALSDLREIQSEDMLFPQQAFCCSLKGIVPESESEDWEKISCSRLEELTFEKDLKVKLVKSLPNCCYEAEVSDGDIFLADTLVQGGYARYSASNTGEEQQVVSEDSKDEEDFHSMKSESIDNVDVGPFKPMTVIQDESYTAVIVNITSPGCFYVLLEESSEDRTKLVSTIDKYVMDHSDEVLSSDELVKGTGCLARTKDGCYGRAVIKETNDQSLEVYFVDLGECHSVDSAFIKPIPSNMFELPAQAVVCCLADIQPREGKEWSEDSIKGFQALSIECNQVSLYVDPLSQRDGLPYNVTVSSSGAKASEMINMQMVELGFADFLPGSPLESEALMDETEVSFTELSLMKENSIGSDDETTDIESSKVTMEESVLETTGASDSFSFLSGKQLDKLITGDKNKEETDDEFYDAEEKDDERRAVQSKVSEQETTELDDSPDGKVSEKEDGKVNDEGSVKEDENELDEDAVTESTTTSEEKKEEETENIGDENEAEENVYTSEELKTEKGCEDEVEEEAIKETAGDLQNLSLVDDKEKVEGNEEEANDSTTETVTGEDPSTDQSQKDSDKEDSMDESFTKEDSKVESKDEVKGSKDEAEHSVEEDDSGSVDIKEQTQVEEKSTKDENYKEENTETIDILDTGKRMDDESDSGV